MSNSIKRRLVTARYINEVIPIRGTRATLNIVDGWHVVTHRIDGFTEGELVIYFEIDSFLPEDRDEFWEYCARGRNRVTLDGRAGYRVRTKMVDKHLSQGLLFPMDSFPQIALIFEDLKSWYGDEKEAEAKLREMSFEDLLGVKKWEQQPSTDSNTPPNTRKPPIFFPQPGCERVQNIDSLFWAYGHEAFQVTEKLDGVPMSVYAVQSSSVWSRALPTLPPYTSSQQQSSVRIGVCGRREDIIEAPESCFWRTATRQGIIANITELREKNVVVQGELCGSSILSNSMGFAPGEHRFYVFDIYDIDKQRRLRPDQVVNICKRLGWDHTPVISHRTALRDFAENIDDLLDKAEGEGVLGRKREGLVFKKLDTGFAFKAIANSWLLETGKQV